MRIDTNNYNYMFKGKLKRTLESYYFLSLYHHISGGLIFSTLKFLFLIFYLKIVLEFLTNVQIFIQVALYSRLETSTTWHSEL